MARREIIQYFDDIDDSPLAEEDVNVVRFSIDGAHYMLDLSEKNAAEFRELLSDYVKVARPVPATGKRTAASNRSKRSQSREIRIWANAEGYQVADRGTIPGHIVEAYNKAHNK